MNSIKCIEHLRKFPGGYGVDGSFGQVAAFISGLDAAKDEYLLEGFREWLIVKVGFGSNLGWSILALHVIFPGRSKMHPSGFSEDESKYAGEMLIDLLLEFLKIRSSGGLTGIYHAYITWLRKQEWYREGFPGYLEEPE
ncbi:hypothetical protein FB566_4400 [Stackebrandtia endophytica]|uniref:Uncharacterized protein n=1 Tax=Stackebrandtia endophytica TaxID=1496996 RepID=A0A543B1W0_9ACTN|nr:hypothetical protein [Stackebrandtia endophytica]TQL78806.1 hypothetical protein FB566_4400 [Stackebrandtia endophytica]